MLGNAAGFARRNVGVADGVEQRGLTVVDVAHDGDDGRTGLEFGFRVFVQIQALFLFDLLGFIDDDGLAEFHTQQNGRFFVQVLVDVGHDAHLHEGHDGVGHGNFQLFAEAAHGDGYVDDDAARCLGFDLGCALLDFLYLLLILGVLLLGGFRQIGELLLEAVAGILVLLSASVVAACRCGISDDFLSAAFGRLLAAEVFLARRSGCGVSTLLALVFLGLAVGRLAVLLAVALLLCRLLGLDGLLRLIRRSADDLDPDIGHVVDRFGLGFRF